jgi:hypothetical protein
MSIMVLIAGHRVVVAQPRRVGQIRVAREQRPGGLAGCSDVVVKAVHRRRAGLGGEGRLAGRVGRVRVSAEVVIKRDVLVEDHDKVLDGSRGVARALVVGVGGADGAARDGAGYPERHRREKARRGGYRVGLR